MMTTNRETAAMGWCDGVLGCDIFRFAISGVAAGNYSNEWPQVSVVMCSDFVRGYFLQLRGRTG
jgi:hypothetical protein